MTQIKKSIKRRLLAHGDYFNITKCGTKNIPILRGLFIIFAVLLNTYVCIPKLILESLTMFYETLFEELYSN